MRIVMLSGELPTDSKSGVGHQVARLSRALEQRGHEVVIRSLSPAPISEKYRVDQISTPNWLRKNKVWTLAALPLAFGTGRYTTFDLIHAHGDNPLLYRKDIPVVRTYYGSAREEARSADRLRRKASQRLLVASEALGRKLATLTVGISQNTSSSLGGLDRVIPCGVDRQLFRPLPKSIRPTILYVGTMSGRKRGQKVLELFKQVIQPKLSDAELWLVSDFLVSGRGIKSFQLISDERIASLFGQAWILVSPSIYEGFGVPYIEAMASGTPIVATPNLGAAELICEARGGILAPDETLGEVVYRLLIDKQRRDTLARNGRKTSAAFDWDLITSQYEEVYETALKRKETGTQP